MRIEPYGAVRAVGEGYSCIALYDDTGNLVDSSIIIVKGGVPINSDGVVFYLGDVGPGGGFVYYDAGDYTRGWRYLEVAPDY